MTREVRRRGGRRRDRRCGAKQVPGEVQWRSNRWSGSGGLSVALLYACDSTLLSLLCFLFIICAGRHSTFKTGSLLFPLDSIHQGYQHCKRFKYSPRVFVIFQHLLPFILSIVRYFSIPPNSCVLSIDIQPYMNRCSIIRSLVNLF